jgi:hypothetical protein
MKAAAHDLRGLQQYYACGIQGLHVPLVFVHFLCSSSFLNWNFFEKMALIDYRGFRVTAVSIIPVSSNTLQYGSSDGGATVMMGNEELNKKIFQAGELLNLKAHKVCPKDPKTINSCADLEGHLGKVSISPFFCFVFVFNFFLTRMDDSICWILLALPRPNLFRPSSNICFFCFCFLFFLLFLFIDCFLRTTEDRICTSSCEWN